MWHYTDTYPNPPLLQRDHPIPRAQSLLLPLPAFWNLGATGITYLNVSPLSGFLFVCLNASRNILGVSAISLNSRASLILFLLELPLSVRMAAIVSENTTLGKTVFQLSLQILVSVSSLNLVQVHLQDFIPSSVFFLI